MADLEETYRERSRSRERTNDDYNDRNSQDRNQDNYESRRERDNSEDGRAPAQQNQEQVHNLYITNLSFQTTDESLKAAFEQFGDNPTASIIKEPVSQSSRGFGFVSFSTLEDCERALEAMHGAEVDGRQIRVEKARRNAGYQKTPGVYLGPPQLSSRFNAKSGRHDRGSRGGGSHSGGGYDRYDRGPPSYREDRMGYRGGGGGYDRMPAYGRVPDYRYDAPYRGRDPRDVREVRGDVRDLPPRYDSRRGDPRDIDPYYSSYPSGGARRSPPPARGAPLDYRRERSPPADRSSGYGGGAGYYSSRGPARY